MAKATKKKLILNGALLTVITVGILLIWFLDYQAKKQNTLMESGVVASRITIIDSNNTITFIKKDNGWWFTDPITAFADQTMLNILADLLTSPYSSKIGKGSNLDLSQFALGDDSLKIILSNEESGLDQQEILFGNTNPVSQERYIMINDTVYTVKRSFKFLFSENGFYAMLSTKLVDFEIESVELSKSNDTISVDATYISMLNNMRGTDVSYYPFEIKKPKAKISIRLKDGAEKIYYAINNNRLVNPKLMALYKLHRDDYSYLINAGTP